MLPPSCPCMMSVSVRFACKISVSVRFACKISAIVVCVQDECVRAVSGKDECLWFACKMSVGVQDEGPCGFPAR